jgi:hypothetical protein
MRAAGRALFWGTIGAAVMGVAAVKVIQHAAGINSVADIKPMLKPMLAPVAEWVNETFRPVKDWVRAHVLGDEGEAGLAGLVHTVGCHKAAPLALTWRVKTEVRRAGGAAARGVQRRGGGGRRVLDRAQSEAQLVVDPSVKLLPQAAM